MRRRPSTRSPRIAAALLLLLCCLVIPSDLFAERRSSSRLIDRGAGAGQRVSALRYFGFNDNSVRAGQLRAARSAELARAAGANVTRLTVDWRWLERSPGRYDFRQYDAIYASAKARGIKPLWIVMFAPAWAADGSLCLGDCRVPPAAAHLGSWRKLVAGIARRYPESAGIEVWNEPNLESFWQTGPDPVRYTRLLQETRTALRDSGSPLPVVGGSLSNNQDSTDGNLSIADFLAKMYESGAGPAMDALAIHPYPQGLDLGPGSLFDRTFEQVRHIRDQAGDSAKPIWVTETGLSTAGTEKRPPTEREQADGLASQYQALSTQPDVEAAIFHTLVDRSVPDRGAESGYGVIRADLSPKPAYCLLRRLRTGRPC